jgi:branched-chain amino acid transport system substrate-binding protein
MSIRMRLLAAAAVVCAAALLAACGGGSSSSSSNTSEATTGGGGGETEAASSEPFKIGSPTDETGELAQFSESWRAGLNAAVAAINESGGIEGSQVEVTYEDMQSDPARATQVVNTMATSGNYNALIPTSAGSVSLPIQQAAARNEALVVGGGALDGIQNPNVYPTEFNMNFPSAEGGAAQACFIQHEGYKKIAIANLSDAYSESQASDTARFAEKLGIEITGKAVWDFSATNITAQLQKLESGNPEAIFVIAYSIPVKVFFSSFKSLNWNIPVIGGISLSSELLLKATQPGTVPKHVYAVGQPSTGGPPNANQKRAIKYLKSAGGVKEFTRNLTGYLYPYDAMMTLKAAVEQSKSTEQAKLIETIEGFEENPPQTWLTNQNPPKISPEIHGLHDAEYKIVDTAAEAVDGQPPTVGKVPQCIKPTVTEMQGPTSGG